MIKLLILDVDGTLTDGQIYMGNNGEIMKSFHAHDAVGLRKLPPSGVETIIITGRESEITNIRAREMNITEVHQNVAEKKQKLKEIIKNKKVKKSEIAYIGDDENDLDAIQLCGLRACPNNAVEKIKSVATFISKYDGGFGAVRELCEYILELNNEHEV